MSIETQEVTLKVRKTPQRSVSCYRVRSLVLGTVKISKRQNATIYSFMFWRPPVFEASTHNLLHVHISITGPRYGASAFCTVGSKALIFMMSCSASNKDGKDTSIRRVQRNSYALLLLDVKTVIQDENCNL